MKMFKKITALLIVFTFISHIMFGTVMVVGNVEDVILFNETFNNLVTNGPAESITITNAEAKIVVDGENNKSLYIRNDVSESIIRKNVGNFGDEYVLSVDLKVEGAPLNMLIGFSAGTGSPIIAPLKIVNNIIKTHDNKIIDSVTDWRYTTITIIVNKSTLYDVFINGKQKIRNWNMPGNISSGDVVIQKGVSETENILYINNFRMYNSKRIYPCIPNAPFNDRYMDRIGVNNDVGDYTYFNNHYMNTSLDTYTNFTAAPKTNLIECKRFDYTNKNRESYIYLSKTTSDDCFFDITLNKHGGWPSNNTYSYYLIEGDFKSENLGSVNQMYLLRDTNTSGSIQQAVTGHLLEDGSLSLTNGPVIPNVAIRGIWFNYKVAVDLAKSSIDVYVNDVLVGSELPINQNVKQLNLVRMSLASGGSGDLYVDNFKVTGLVRPFVDGVETKTSVFPELNEVKEFLENKIAFHGYGKSMYANNEKSMLDDIAVYENDELYISHEDLNKAFGLSLSFDSEAKDLKSEDLTISKDGQITYQGKTITLENKPKLQGETLLVPVMDFGKNVLNKQVFYYETGIILFSEQTIHLDTRGQMYYTVRTYSNRVTLFTDIDFLNNFLHFVQPHASEIEQAFNETTDNGAMHPRIIMTQEDFDKIADAREDDETLENMVITMISRADDILNQPVIDYIYQDKMRMLRNAIDLVTKMQNLGFAWHMTGDDKYVERAWEEFQSLGTFPDFNTSHVIDSGEFNLAMAIGYDWMYHGFTEQQRAFISGIILNRSLKDLASGYYGRLSSISNGGFSGHAFRWVSNYNAHVNSGTIAAALAVAEENPEYCFDVVEKALRSLEYTAIGFAPDGGWTEGYGYWGTTTRLLLPIIITLQNATGKDYGFSNYQGIKDSIYFAISLSGPRGYNNFGDAAFPTGYVTNYNYSIYGHLYDLPEVLALRKEHIEAGTSFDLYDVLFYDPTVDIDIIEQLPHAVKTSGIESFSIREKYGVSDKGLFLSAKFGATSGFHKQNDVGTFVFDMLGQRWALDLGSENYNLINELGIKRSDLYRTRSEGHNICVINPHMGYNQTEGRFAPIIEFKHNERSAYVVGDNTEIYPDVEHMLLGYYVGDDMRSLTIRNEMQLKKESTVYWFMHTQANIQISGNEAYLMRGGQSMKLKFTTNADEFELLSMNAVPLPTSPNPPEQNPNDGIRKIAIRMKASNALNLTVKLAPLGEPASETPVMDIPISQWQLDQGEKTSHEVADLGFKIFADGHEIVDRLPIFEDADLPNIEVVTSDPNAIVEIEYGETIDDLTIVRVYDETKSYYKLGSVSYFKATGASMSMYDEYEIQDVMVSSEPEPVNRKENMIDDDFSTRWTSMAIGEYAVFDLGEVKPIDALAIAFWRGRERAYKFEIHASKDGEVYEKILSQSSGGLTDSYEVFPVETYDARYIKFVGLGNSVSSAANVNNNILEFRALRNKYLGEERR